MAVKDSKGSVNKPNDRENAPGICPKLTKSGLEVGSRMRTWMELSRINFFSSHASRFYLEDSDVNVRKNSKFADTPELRQSSVEDFITEQFPAKMTKLLNENNYWGGFYCFPELYADAYSPGVRIRSKDDVPELLGGVLTRDLVNACLTYLKRTPILGDFVYIKLELSSKFLKNIQVLQHYKFLVYLDLSSNLLSELKVLSYLLYLQYLSVAFNRLNTVLEYDTPQWFLTEVHYKYNSVKRIADLSQFWSITVLDLSHNNITAITGLETLNYLRHLDLSFNHIQRLENLNHLRLLWLDVSYNNISSFEFGDNAGLWTLLHLEYLNLNENNLTSIKIFSGVTRIRELHVRNNRLGTFLELAVYMRKMRRLIILDLRSNPICSLPGYQDVVINTFPLLMSLDAVELDPVKLRRSKSRLAPNIKTFAIRRLLRLLFVEQLSQARVAPTVPPADTTEIPLVVLVGYEAVGKGTLARRLASECSDHVELGISHTTAPYHHPGHYKEIKRLKFDEMLIAGEFLVYWEMDGESYGLSREEAFITPGKVRIVCLDLIGALMLKFRGRRPYFILANCQDKVGLATRQKARKTCRINIDHCKSNMMPFERSTLQVLLSGRILVNGILNEIILNLDDEKVHSEFVVDSECSLMMDSETRAKAARHSKGIDLLFFSSATSLEEGIKETPEQSNVDQSLYSLYKSSANGEFNSYINEKLSTGQERKSIAKKPDIPLEIHGKDPGNGGTRLKSVDFSRYASSTWKGVSGQILEGSKSSKSVTFTSGDAVGEVDPTGLLIEPPPDNQTSVGAQAQSRSVGTVDDPYLLFGQMKCYTKLDTISESVTTNTQDEYEELHRKLPGVFRDTVTMDDPEAAFLKVKNIIKNLFIEQKTLKPMFDINFDELPFYPTVEKRLKDICKQIAPHRMFN